MFLIECLKFTKESVSLTALTSFGIQVFKSNNVSLNHEACLRPRLHETGKKSNRHEY